MYPGKIERNHKRKNWFPFEEIVDSIVSLYASSLQHISAEVMKFATTDLAVRDPIYMTYKKSGPLVKICNLMDTF